MEKRLEGGGKNLVLSLFTPKGVREAQLTRQIVVRVGHPRQRRPLRHDDRPASLRGRPSHGSDRHVAAKLGDVHLLLRSARGIVPDDIPAAALQHTLRARPSGYDLGCYLRCYGWRDNVAGSACAAVLLG